MHMTLAGIDLAILAIYAVFIFGLAQWVSRTKAGEQKTSTDYFMASKSLPWWAIGASLIAANISAEQIIGMSGSGYVIGLGIASYEWMAALTLLIVGKFFLPIFLRNDIVTMPQFLQQRYGPTIRNVMAVFWLLLYVFVNVTSILWLGAIAGEGGAAAGFHTLLTQFPEKFDMILSKDNPHYQELPGIAVLLGGLWVMNISYWGFNQYIIQRALAAKSLPEAQKGIAFAAYLKLLMPVIVVLPGMAALILAPNLSAPDQAYPSMMNLLPVGLKGLVFAALIAAIIASLASKVNSISTI